jgi:RND family efflux transporter MFP subunit
VDVGALITAGSPTDNTAVAPTNVTGAANGLFEVADTSRLRVFVNVPQVFALGVRAGMPVELTFRGQAEAKVAASVTRTASAVDPGTRTLLTQVDVASPSGRLLPGMFVYVTFKITASGKRWRVPATAVILDGQGSRVAVVGPAHTIRFQPVELGRDFGDSFEVETGLEGHEAVVLQPTVALREGQVVRPIASDVTPSN